MQPASENAIGGKRIKFQRWPRRRLTFLRRRILRGVSDCGLFPEHETINCPPGVYFTRTLESHLTLKNVKVPIGCSGKETEGWPPVQLGAGPLLLVALPLLS